MKASEIAVGPSTVDGFLCVSVTQQVRLGKQPDKVDQIFSIRFAIRVSVRIVVYIIGSLTWFPVSSSVCFMLWDVVIPTHHAQLKNLGQTLLRKCYFSFDD